MEAKVGTMVLKLRRHEVTSRHGDLVPGQGLSRGGWGGPSV